MLQSLKRELVITLIALQRGTYFITPLLKGREIKERRGQLIREIKKEDSTIGQGDKREERMIVGEMKERRVQSGRCGGVQSVREIKEGRVHPVREIKEGSVHSVRVVSRCGLAVRR